MADCPSCKATAQDTSFAVGMHACCLLWVSLLQQCDSVLDAKINMQVLFYPTAIGSEPQDSKLNSYPHWCRVMQGHAGANLTPLVASNRVGLEKMSRSEITFYGGSFIAGPTGEVHAQIGCKTECSHGSIDPEPERVEGVAVVSFDLEAIRWQRASWGLFRDRRPDMYGPLMTSDGSMRPPACR